MARPSEKNSPGRSPPQKIRDALIAQGVPEDVPDRMLGSLADYAKQPGPSSHPFRISWVAPHLPSLSGRPARRRLSKHLRRVTLIARIRHSIARATGACQFHDCGNRTARAKSLFTLIQGQYRHYQDHAHHT